MQRNKEWIKIIYKSRKKEQNDILKSLKNAYVRITKQLVIPEITVEWVYTVLAYKSRLCSDIFLKYIVGLVTFPYQPAPAAWNMMIYSELVWCSSRDWKYCYKVKEKKTSVTSSKQFLENINYNFQTKPLLSNEQNCTFSGSLTLACTYEMILSRSRGLNNIFYNYVCNFSFFW